MRLLSPMAIVCCLLGCLVTLACAESRTVPPPPPSELTLVTSSEIQALGGLWRMTVDPATLATSLTPEPLRSATDNDDLYLLSTNRFFSSGVIRITNVQTSDTRLEIDYEITHPFPAPTDPTAPASAGNRADLGIAGHLAFLVEVPTATGNTFFSDRVANTSLIVNPDHYYAPAGLISQLLLPANTFPCQTLVDELDGGTRKGIDNGGLPTGNFGTDGWTRAEFGSSNDGWTGYGVLHQGQTSARRVSVDLAALSAIGTLDINIALLVRYNDPRGGATPDEKRANRLPPAAPDHEQFAYRMPHGALDGAPVKFIADSGTFEADLASSSTLSFTVVDWDARASETTEANLFNDPDVTKVAAGESGVPALAICIPGVLGTAATVDLWATETLLDDDTSIGGDLAADSGHPGDALYYSKQVAKMAGSGQTGGTYIGMVRVTDPEASLAPPLAVALDAATLAPLTVDLPESVTYQAFTVEQQPGPTGVPGWVVTFGEGDSATAYEVAANDAGQSSIAGEDDFAGPDLPFIHTSRYAIDGAQNWTREYLSLDSSSRGVAIDDVGNTYLTGLFRTSIDFGQGPINPVGTVDCFILKLDSSGETVWLRSFGGTLSDVRGNGLALDSLGRVLVIGNFKGTVNFGGVPRASSDVYNSFVLQLSNGGIYQWDRVFSVSSETGGNFGGGISTSVGDSVVAVGYFNDSLNFGGGLRHAVGYADSYAACLTQAGAYAWDFTWGSDQGAWPGDVVADLQTGRVFVGGATTGSVLGQTYAGGLDAVLLGLSNVGSLNWVQQFGGTGDDSVGGLAITPIRRLYVSGGFEGTCTACNGGTPAVGGRDAFIVRMDFDGTPSWHRSIGGLADEYATDVDVDGDGDLRMAGYFNGTCDFDPGPGLLNRTAVGQDGFVLRLSGATGYL